MNPCLRCACAFALAPFFALGIGCSSKSAPETLKPQAFYESRHRVVPVPQSKSQANAAATSSWASYGASANGAPNGSPAPLTASPPTPAPTTNPTLSTGSYMLVGTVIGEVNGQRIFADKILAQLETALHAKATQTNPALGPDEFRRSATGLIADEVEKEVNEELFFAAAQRNTTEQDQTLAAALTTVFRAKEITRAGGSEAVARAHWQRQGLDFEERVQQEYRRKLVGIYLSKKVWPRISVTADDRREFYARNLDAAFTEKAEVKFRAIRIGIREMGTGDAAIERAKNLHTRAGGGEDFGKLAAQFNQDRSLAQSRGYMFVQKDPLGQVIKDDKGEPIGASVPRGTLANEELEKAIFALNPGDIGEVMRHGDYYWIVKLEERKAGRVRAFEEPEVQEAIRLRLESEQQRALQEKELRKLRNGSILSGAALRTSEQEYLKHLQPLIEMAMQKYHAWNRPQPSASAR